MRVSLAATLGGPTAVVRLSGAVGAEPAEAKRWREASPGLLLVIGDRHADTDACLRAILAAHAGKCVAVDLPAPEVICVESLDQALALDPDIVCVARLWDARTAARLAGAVEEGIHAVASAATARVFDGVPHSVVTA